MEFKNKGFLKNSILNPRFWFMVWVWSSPGYPLESPEKGGLREKSALMEDTQPDNGFSSLRDLSLESFPPYNSKTGGLNLEMQDGSKELKTPWSLLDQGEQSRQSVPIGGLREQILALAKNRHPSPSLMEELKKSFKENLPDELRVLLQDPTFTALLPNVRPCRSFITTGVSASQPKVTKASALKAVKSLTDALCAAYYFNPELEVARKKINVAVNNLSKAFAVMRPAISFDLGHNQVGNLETQKGNNPLARDENGLPVMNLKNRQRTWENRATILAKQSLFSGGGIIANIMKQKAEFLTACWEYLVAEQTVLLKVTEAFLDYLLADELLRMEELNAATLHMLFKASSIGFSAGIDKAGDRSLAAGQALMQGDVKVIEARKTRDTNRVKLQVLIGAPIDLLESLIMPGKFKNLPKNVQQLRKLILKNNPTVQGSSMALVGKKHEVSMMVAAFLPKVALEGSVSRKMNNRTQVTSPVQLSNQDTSHSSNAQFGIGLTMPIYDRGLSHANFRAVEQEVKIARLTLENSKRETLSTGLQQWNMLSASLVNQSLTFRAVLFYTQALLNAQKEYDAGVLTIVDFIRIQDSWINACRSWILQRFSVVKSSAFVAGCLGRMTAKYLKLPVALFNPKKYYQEYASNWVGLGENEEDNALFDQDPLERKE